MYKSIYDSIKELEFKKLKLTYQLHAVRERNQLSRQIQIIRDKQFKSMLQLIKFTIW